MGTTNILDLNNRVSKLADSVTSVEDALDEVMTEVVASVTADGTKTYSELLSELYPYRTTGTYLDIGGVRHWGESGDSFGSVLFDNSNTIAMFTAYLTSSGSLYAKATIDNSGTSRFVNLASNVPSQGKVIKLVKMYKAR